ALFRGWRRCTRLAERHVRKVHVLFGCSAGRMGGPAGVGRRRIRRRPPGRGAAFIRAREGVGGLFGLREWPRAEEGVNLELRPRKSCAFPRLDNVYPLRGNAREQSPRALCLLRRPDGGTRRGGEAPHSDRKSVV